MTPPLPCSSPQGGMVGAVGVSTTTTFPNSGKSWLPSYYCPNQNSSLSRVPSLSFESGKLSAISGRGSASFMRVRVCHHLFDNGKFCQAVPLRGRIYCYHHHQALERKMRMAWARARVALRLAKERESGIRIPLVKRGPKSVQDLPVSLMESHG